MGPQNSIAENRLGVVPRPPPISRWNSRAPRHAACPALTAARNNTPISLLHKPRNLHTALLVVLLSGLVLFPGTRIQSAEVTVEATPARGLFTQSFDLRLNLSSPPATAEIWYTTDASDPHNGFDGQSPRGQVYTAPIPLSSNTVVRTRAFSPAGPLGPTRTHSFLFFSSTMLQSTNPAGFPALWGLRKADYAMDNRVITNTAYAPLLSQQWTGLPVVSLVAPVPDLFGPQGIYPNSDQSGTNWERAASLELLPHASWGDGIQINAGLQILGESSRDPSNPKHSFRVSFKSRYGPSRLEFPVFTNSPVRRFDNLDVLAGSFDGVTMNFQDIDLNAPSYARDAWLKKTQLDMGQPGIHTRFVHLYVNGLYWGLYHLGERPDAGYADEYLGGKKSEFDVLKHADTATLEVVDGDRQAWDSMVAIAAQGLTNDSQYAAIQDYLNVTDFADYLIANMHSGNGDWPQKNWYAVRKRKPGESFRFFCWDGDAVLGLVSTNINKTTFATTNTPAYLYDKLRNNAEFRQLFGDRIQQLVMGQGPLSPTANLNRLKSIVSEVEQGIVLESARWGDANFKRPGRSLFLPNDHWKPEIDRMLLKVIPHRHDVSMRHFKAAGLYPLISPPEFSTPPGWVESGSTIRVTHADTHAGAVLWVTTRGVDPRLPGGSIHPDAFVPLDGIRVTGDIHVLARVQVGKDWSALIQGRFVALDRPVLSWIREPSIPDAISLQFEARSNAVYQVEHSNQIPMAEWSRLEIFDAHATNRLVRLPIDTAPTPQSFFRVRVLGTP